MAELNESSSDQTIGTIASPTMITTAGRTNAQAVGFSPRIRWANVLCGGRLRAHLIRGSTAGHLQLGVRGLDRLAQRLAGSASLQRTDATALPSACEICG